MLCAGVGRGSRCIKKMHEKKGFKKVLERSEGVLGFSKKNSTLNRRKLIKN